MTPATLQNYLSPQEHSQSIGWRTFLGHSALRRRVQLTVVQRPGLPDRLAVVTEDADRRFEVPFTFLLLDDLGCCIMMYSAAEM